MRIPDKLIRTVLFIGYKKTDGSVSLQGTGFFFGEPIQGVEEAVIYIVTARHIIDGIKGLSDFNGTIVLKINDTNGGIRFFETGVDHWAFHEEEIELDVAVSIMIASTVVELDITMLPLEMLNPSHLLNSDVGVGDEVFLPGLFHSHHGKKRNYPIVRFGNISAIPNERVKSQIGFIEAYLIESRSIGGLSGSPVFLNLGMTRFLHGQLQRAIGGKPNILFLGLCHGHFEVKNFILDEADIPAKQTEKINMGIAMVVPAYKILEVISQQKLKSAVEKIHDNARHFLNSEKIT